MTGFKALIANFNVFFKSMSYNCFLVDSIQSERETYQTLTK